MHAIASPLAMILPYCALNVNRAAIKKDLEKKRKKSKITLAFPADFRQYVITVRR
jgi:hypothetical protein